MSLVAVVVPQMYSLEGKNSDTAFSKLSSQSSYLLDAPGNLKNMQRRLKMFGFLKRKAVQRRFVSTSIDITCRPVARLVTQSL
ncbi:hypothetical protein LSAT2_028057 [Lamellibrachia satsuma]|nr:hypothetical protein LSAT2_028057 [Lamellibrachia satsuma]